MIATVASSSPIAGSLALAMTRDKSASWGIEVFEADGVTPQNLTGATLYFHAKVGGILITKSSPSSGITITSVTGGAASLVLSPSDTAGLSGSGVYSGACELTMVTGSYTYELSSGTLEVSPNVGTP